MQEREEGTTENYLQELSDEVNEIPEIEIPEYEFANEHEKKLAELRAYFWFAFSVYDEDEINTDDIDSDDYELDKSYHRCEESYQDLRKEFVAIGELAEFHRLYLDYCQDLLAVQKKRMAKRINECDISIENAIKELNNPKNIKKRAKMENYVKKLKKVKRQSIAFMENSQQSTRNDISVTKRKLRGLGYIGPDYQKKKTTVTIKPTGVVNGKLGITVKENMATTDGGLNIPETSK